MPEELAHVRKRYPLVDGIARVTGRAQFAGDIRLPGMLYGKILRSPHAYAKVVGIDTSKAEALPGVKAVITFKDTVVRWGQYGDQVGAPDCYVLQETVRFVGDPIAAVAAITEDIAEEALELIKVDYDVKPFVLDPEAAMKPDAPMLHTDYKGNLGLTRNTKRGDVAAGLAAADVTVERTYRIDRYDHMPAETGAVVATWEGDNLIAWDTCQVPFREQTGVSINLGIPINKIRIIVPYKAASYGKHYHGRKIETAALLSKKAGKPVKIMLDREEDVVHDHNGERGNPLVRVKVGAKKDGTLTAVEGEAIGWSGGYRPRYTIYLPVAETYTVPNVDFRERSYVTNTPDVGPMRGVGSVQSHFVSGTIMDELAEKLGIDIVDLTLKTAEFRMDQGGAGSTTLLNLPWTSCGLEECIRTGAESFGWKGKWHKPGEKTLPDGRKHGVGFGIYGAYRAGAPGTAISLANVQINLDGTVNLKAGITDAGTHSKTTQCQVAAEALGVPFEKVTITWGDTQATPYDAGSVGSRVAPNMSIAVKNACLDAKKKLLEAAAKVLAVKPEELETKDGYVYIKATPEKKITFAEAISKGIASAAGGIVGSGASEGIDTTRFRWASFAAHFVEVAVDTETGDTEVLNATCVHDVGTPINPTVVELQIISGFIMGIGYTLREAVVYDKATGKILNPSPLNYMIATAPVMPKNIVPMTSATLDPPPSAYGIKHAGEPAAIPSLPAIANAVYNAIGVRMRELPITPERILKALGKA